MAEAFARAGWQVIYWTADFNHVTKRLREMTGSPPVGISLKIVHEPPYCRNIGLKRLWSHWRWAKNWTVAAAAEGCPDVVVVSSPPLAIVREVEKYARKRNVRVVVDVMDAWPETFERIVPRLALWPLRRIAKANYLGADAITTVADAYLELAAGYGFTGPAHRFYHGIRMENTGRHPTERCDSGVESSKNSKIKMVYAGSLGKTYDLATAMEAVALLDGVELSVAGRGEREKMLRCLADEPRFAGKISFVGCLGDSELSAFLASGDIGLVPMAPESCVGVPYKLADYSRAGLAVASSLGGESARLAARYGAGEPYTAGDAGSLADAVRRIIPRLDQAKSGSLEMARREFDAETIYSEYVDFIEKTAGKEG